MNEVMLGCPHCGKPVGFARAVAGQVVACPHCRGAFQMPDRPPPGPGRVPRPAAADDGSLAFDAGPPDARSPRARAELDSYRAAASLATAFAVVGIAAVLLVAGTVVYSLIVPVFRGTEGRAPSAAAGALWLVSVALFTALGITAVLLVRACVLVGLDAARALRALERDLGVPKSK